MSVVSRNQQGSIETSYSVPSSRVPVHADQRSLTGVLARSGNGAMDAPLDFEVGNEGASDTSEDRAAVARTSIEPEAFSLLYQKYARDVYRYCYRRLEDREAAEDATSHIFMNAFAALPVLGDRPFRPWLFTIARNAVIDRCRRRGPVEIPLTVLYELADGAVSPEEAAIDRENATAIRRLFDHLSERDRLIVELRLAGLSGLEVAQSLQCSHAVVRTAQHRAFGKIRALLVESELKSNARPL